MIAGSTLEAVEHVKEILCKKFRMKDFGIIREFLGMQFEFGKNFVKLHQEKYISKILEHFGMKECNPKIILCDPSVVKIEDADSNIFENNRLYREMVGSLVYLTTCTRPDLAYIVSKLSERLENPTQAHFNACKHVLKYLKGSADKGLVYHRSGGEQLALIGYSDSDWGSSPDRKSVSGFCYQLAANNCFISWKTKKQPTVALSSCEAEYDECQ